MWYIMWLVFEFIWTNHKLLMRWGYFMSCMVLYFTVYLIYYLFFYLLRQHSKYSTATSTLSSTAVYRDVFPWCVPCCWCCGPPLCYPDLASDGSSLEAQMRLKRARLAEDLNEKLALRPGPLELVQKNIIPLDSAVTMTGIRGQIPARGATHL